MRYKKNKGFTLIELMIVVAVVAILAAVAYPSYQDSVQKTRRADAKAALERAAGLQERFFTENNSYAFPADIGKVGGASSTEGYYTITLANTDLAGTSCVSGGYAPCFLFTATATGVQTKDTDCDKFTLDEKGALSALFSFYRLSVFRPQLYWFWKRVIIGWRKGFRAVYFAMGYLARG